MFESCCKNDWMCPYNQARQEFGPAPAPDYDSFQQSRQTKPYTPMDGKHSTSMSTAPGDYSSPDSNNTKQSHYVIDRMSPETVVHVATAPIVQFQPRSLKLNLDHINSMIDSTQRSCSVLTLECRRREVGYGKALLVMRRNFKALNNKYQQQVRELDHIESVISQWEKSKRRIAGWHHQ